jgi:nitrite reductase/ring-hydroxylating ferredoxin subunit
MVSILFPNGGCPPLRPSHDDEMEANPLPSRRQIVKRFVLGSVGWWAAGSWRSQELLGAVLPTTGTLVLPLSAFPALAADGGSIRLYAGLDQTLIINRSGNTFYALGSRCSHAGCPVGTYVAANGSMRCPCHGSEYFIDGTVKQGPAPDPLDSFPTVFHGGSEVRVTVPNVTFGARVIQVMSESGGTRRFKLSFHATPFRDYRIEYRASLGGVAQIIPFSATLGGPATQTTYRSTIPALTPPLTDLYVDATGSSGFFSIVLIPSLE